MSPTVSQLVERQMRHWRLLSEAQSRPSGGLHPSTPTFVTISVAIGSGGRAVAAALGRTLGWPVFDKELLQHMAANDAIRAQLYELMDGRDTTWMESLLRWAMRGEFRKEDFCHRLAETVLALARKGSVVLVGRGCDLILPPDHGLRVRITAPEAERLHRYAAEQNLDPKTAAREIERIELERREFFRRHFAREYGDVSRFDLVINLQRLGEQHAVDLIHRAVATLGMLEAPEPAIAAISRS